ncbi:MAG: dihydropteroate synthase [Candidatus Neomarinimicrobiota bacterium]
MKKYFQNWCENPNRETLVMGIVNVTPDSFSDGGRFLQTKKAFNHARKLIYDGADIIDIGGESTRPGANKVSQSEELIRVIPVIEAIRLNFPDIIISIDTTKSVVASEAIQAGADIINDVSGLDLDRKMIETVASLKVPIIIMHMQGNPRNMQINPEYQDLIDDIILFFKEKIKIAKKSGINKNLIIIDPGIGFGKTVKHNFELIAKLNDFNKFGLPIMVGPSRKSFIGETLNLPVDSRIEGTSAAITASILNGARIVRVHDVLEMKRVVEISERIRTIV